MNLLMYHLKHVPKILGSFRRSYAIEKFSIEWTRPEKISCILPEKSGDLGLDYKIHPEEPCKLYENVPELQNANELVKKFFSLEFNPSKQTAKLMKERAISLVKRHESDRGSHECHIAEMTTEIHRMQDHMQRHPRNIKCKVLLKEKIDKRKKYLKRLRTWDYKRFEWILEKLNLIYKPPPEKFYFVSRKDSVRKLAAMHCNKVKQEKLDAYKTELKAQQKDFFKQKANKIAFIREEEIACGLEPSISLEDIENANRLTKQYGEF
ncbi:28S ribosomal protein S15, mitochondrial [Belonocnema kinseyi]|uniref:28S ribosomal protein S15, mitochondrial n=1 Tax=Belonocnema kinseyi TaxID=2817044 RepID=UPI00143D1C65|nr:28S ribosomal protein S15, mitochondrial [Belonocnema kinseyi]